MCRYLLKPSDPAPLRRPAAIVRDGGHVLDRTDLQAGRLQRPDGGLPARARTLDEDVDLAHAVLHGAARRGFRRHLRGVRRGFARSLEPDLTRGRPRDDVAGRVGDRDDRVVERAPDVGVPVSDVLPLLAAHLLGGLLTAPWRHILLWLPCEVIDPWSWLTDGLLLPGLLLAGHRLLLALAGARVRLRPLPVHREPATVADALVAADLDLAPDVGLDLAAQVTFDLVGRVDPVAELHQLLVAEAADPGVPVDAGRRQRLQRPRAADAVDIGERDLDPLVAGQVHSRKPGHVRAVLLRLAEVLRAAPAPCPDTAPASDRGSQPRMAACGTRLSIWSALALLVPGVGADDHDAAVPTDDPALTADLLDARL